MFFKFAFVFAALLSLSECKPTEDVSFGEDYPEMQEFSRAMANFVSDMSRTIESYLYPIFELFAALDEKDIKALENSESFPFTVEGMEENEMCTDIHDVRCDLVEVVPIPEAK